MSTPSQFQSLYYRILNDEKTKEEFSNDPLEVINRAGITGEAEITEFMAYLNQPNHLLRDSFQQTMKLADRFKESVKISLEQIENGYKGAMWMYWLAFLTGILLVITAIIFAFMEKGQLLSIVFGSLGTLDLLTFFIMKPPMELQNSRIGFARLEAAFMNWFIDLTNLNSLFQHLNSAYGVGQFDAKGAPVPTSPQLFTEYLKQFMSISNQSLVNTERTLSMMGQIIREEEISTEKSKRPANET